MDRGSVPIQAWMILTAAVVAVSSAGAVLQSIDSVPPLLRMSWRLQATSLVLLPFAILQWNRTNPDTCLLYTSPSPRDVEESRMPSSA